MKFDRKSDTYYMSLELYAQAVNKGVTRRVTFEQVLDGGFNQRAGAEDTFHIQEELAIVEKGILRTLSPKALKLVVQLMDELCMNNALWYFKATDSHNRAAVKELRDRDILLRTEDAAIHYVNPAYIRRGSRAGVLAHTTQVLSTVKRVTTDLIKDLRTKDKITFNGFDRLVK